MSLHSNQIGSINLQARMIESDMYTQSNYRDSIQDVLRRLLQPLTRNTLGHSFSKYEKLTFGSLIGGVPRRLRVAALPVPSY